VKIATTAVANVGDWSISFDDAVVDITGLGATVRTSLGVGLPTITGSVNFVALDNVDASTVLVKAGLSAGTSVDLRLYEDSSKYWYMPTCWITNFSSATSVDGVVSGAFSFTASGAVTYP